MRRILVLAANPQGTAQLRLDKEVRGIDEALSQSPFRDQFELHQRWAIRPRDLQRAMLDIEPEIVHFCGHGEGQAGIVLEDASGQIKLVGTAALSSLFGLCAERLRCVLLNACYAEVQADAIVQHIDYVIGMRQAVPDDVAITFSTGFYQGLGAGKSIEDAFQSGCESIRMSLKDVRECDRKVTVLNPIQKVADSTFLYEQIPVLKQSKNQVKGSIFEVRR